MKQAFCLLVLVLVLTGCRREQAARTGPDYIRFVTISNRCDVPLDFEIRIGQEPLEVLTLQPKAGLFLYEKVQEGLEISSLEPIRSSISSGDGAKLEQAKPGGQGFAASSTGGAKMSLYGLGGHLQAVKNGVDGKPTAQGYGSGVPMGVPGPEWLKEQRFQARAVTGLSIVDVNIRNGSVVDSPQ